VTNRGGLTVSINAVSTGGLSKSGWDKKGRKTRVTQNGGHLRINVIGMVCPRSAEFFAIEASHSDSATYQAFLDEADKSISLILLILSLFVQPP